MMDGFHGQTFVHVAQSTVLLLPKEIAWKVQFIQLASYKKDREYDITEPFNPDLCIDLDLLNYIPGIRQN